MTTYATLVSEFQNEESIVHDVNWFRVVLDEGLPNSHALIESGKAHPVSAHSIRHESTQQSCAVASLSASLRWCLTGTPIHNSLYDLGSLVNFLRISQLESKAALRKHIVKPISERQAGGIARLQLLLKSICLRRTTDCLQLPELEEIVERVQLSSEESLLYRAIQGRARTEISRSVCISGNPNTESILLRTVTRLRRMCNHGIIDSKLQQDVRADDLLEDEDGKIDSVGLGDDRWCTKCSCDIKVISNDPGTETGRFTTCNDLLCSDCYVEWEQATTKGPSRSKPRCPICRKTVSKSGASGKRAPRQDGLDFQGQCAKISHLVEDIRRNGKKWYVGDSLTVTCISFGGHILSSEADHHPPALCSRRGRKPLTLLVIFLVAEAFPTGGSTERQIRQRE